MTHICVITSVHKPFDGRIFHRECTALVQAGYQVTLLAPADFEQQVVKGVEVIGIPLPDNRLQRPLVWWRLYRRLRSLQPDVVHLHDPELLLLVPLLRVTLGRRVKIVYDVHEYFVDALSEKYWIPSRLRPLAVSVAGWLEKQLIRGVQGIVCAVEGQTPLYNGFQGPIAVVRNLPAARLFEEAEPHPTLAVGGFKLIYVGLILPERGIDVLLDAMCMLHRQGVDDVYLFLIGPDTSSDYIQSIQEFAKVYQLSDQVHWLGYIPHHQLKHYLVAAHVGLAPGLHTRQYKNPGLTTKIFEYLLCGLPVLSTDYPHRRVYLEESNCGLTVPARDVSAHADAILWLRDHPMEARAMGERGQAMVLDHYTWEAERKNLLTFYQALEGKSDLSPGLEGDTR